MTLKVEKNRLPSRDILICLTGIFLTLPGLHDHCRRQKVCEVGIPLSITNDSKSQESGLRASSPQPHLPTSPLISYHQHARRYQGLRPIRMYLVPTIRQRRAATNRTNHLFDPSRFPSFLLRPSPTAVLALRQIFDSRGNPTVEVDLYTVRSALSSTGCAF
jgi:hypothetical protein